MFRCLLPLFLFFLPLLANPKEPHTLAVTEGEPSSLIDGCVSAITGELYLAQDDLVIQGYIPLRLPRHYISGDGKKNGWFFLSHLNAYYKGGQTHHTIVIQETNGSTYRFQADAEKVLERYAKHKSKDEKRKKQTKHPIKFRPIIEQMIGISNTAQAEISAKNNLKNAYVTLEDSGTHFTLHCSDGTKRSYKIHHKRKRFKEIFREEEKAKVKFLLETETLSTGHKVLYNYDKEDRLTSLATSSPRGKTYAKATFHYHHHNPKKNPGFDIRTSDGRTLHYAFEEKHHTHFLAQVSCSERPQEALHYHPKASHGGNLLSRQAIANQSLDIDYYLIGKNRVGPDTIKVHDHKDPLFLRVKTIKKPVSGDGTAQLTHRIDYHPQEQYTDVRDHQNLLTRYHYSKELQLTAIQRYDAGDLPYNKETFTWTLEGELLTHTLSNANGDLILQKLLRYDGRGNPLEETLRGNLTGEVVAKLRFCRFSGSFEPILHSFSGVNIRMLILTPEKECKIGQNNPENRRTLSFATTSGSNPDETYTIYREYDQLDNLIKSQEQNGKTTLHTYLANSSLPSSQLLLCHGVICRRHFFFYNDDCVLVQEIQDDGNTPHSHDLSGVTHRTIRTVTPTASGPYQDLPEWITESYWEKGEEKLLKKSKLTYTTGGRVSAEEIYDSQNSHRYTLYTKHDEQGRVTSKTNPLGETEQYSYDGANRLTEVKKARLTQQFSYDCMNRLLQSKEIGDDGLERNTTHTYDRNGNRTSTTDPYGHTTHYVYSSRGYPTETHLPDGSILRYHYNSTGQKISEISSLGYTTDFHYNARNQITQIDYPDKTGQRSIYNLDGTLQKQMDAGGGITLYERDPLGRVLQVTDPLGREERYSYRGDQLSCFTDAEGDTTTYDYDGAGCKIAEQRGDETTYYSYDPLDRLHATTRGRLTHIEERDLTDRLIEERTEENGTLLTQVQYRYDSAGDRIQVIRSIQGEISLETYRFDSQHRLIESKDPLDGSHTIHYDDNYIEDGQRLLQTLFTDGLGLQEITTYSSRGVPIRKEKKSPEGKLLSQDTYLYNSENQLLQHTSIRLPQNLPVTELREYDNRGRLSSMTQAAGTPESRSTRFQYTPTGQIAQKSFPDIALNYHYDAAHNLIALSSTDQTVHYTYAYDRCNRLIEIQDHLTAAATRRSYNSNGRVTAEQLGNSLLLKNHWDDQGRRVLLTLPDHSHIAYRYGALHLEEVIRQDSQGVSLYSHTYLNRDRSGHLLKEELPLHLGPLFSTYDLKGRRSSLSSPYFRQEVLAYDAEDNLCRLKTQDQEAEYHYDGLYQLTIEPGHNYFCDSHLNRIAHNENAEGLSSESFNALCQSESLLYDFRGNLLQREDTCYRYDGLNRLIFLEDSSMRLFFTYDALNRRLSQTLYTREQNRWHEQQKLLFLYDGQEEIGAVCDGLLVQLRILGEENSTIAFELEGQLYIPHRDLQGNSPLLLDAEGTIIESLSHDAFGNISTSSLNPYSTHGKRRDPSGLIYYGERYYDSKVGRWLTCDPLGDIDGINSYAFLHNNPLTHFDRYGLLTEGWGVSEVAPLAINPLLWSVAPWILPPSVAAPQTVSPSAQTPKQVAVFFPKGSARLSGSLRALGGLMEAGVAGAATFATVGWAAPIAWPVMAHGLDQFFTGISTAFTGRHTDTLISQLLQNAGLSSQISDMIDSGLSIAGSMGAATMIRASQIAAFQKFYLPTNYTIIPSQANEQILFGQKSVSAFFSQRGTCKSKSIFEVVQELKNGTVSPESFPIEIIVRNGQRITLNNRSLLTLRRAGMEPKIIIDRTGIKEYEFFLDDHLKGNLPSNVIKIRGGPSGTSLIGSIE